MKQLLLLLLFAVGSAAQIKKENGMPPFYSFTMKTIDGKEKSLSEYRGKVVMVVNVASFCGYTPQYKELEAIYKKYKDQGFVIVGFPANDFGKQEPGSDTDIKTFCEREYGVTFDLFSKIDVLGDGIHPLYKYLTTETDFKGEIGWNFTKFLVDKNGNVVARFIHKMKPDEPEIVNTIEDLLRRK